MINTTYFKKLLKYLEFEENGDIFSKKFEDDVYLKVDFKKEEIIYPENHGFKINERQTCNFSSSENMVVLEAVYQLLKKGYKPKHIELEPKWKLGRGASGGRADILVKKQNEKPLLIIECKTYGKEFEKAWKETKEDGGQLFSYAQQIAETEFLCLYASEFDEKNNQLLKEQRIISHKDNEEILAQDKTLKSYKQATNVKERFEVWKKTYQLEFTQTGIFEESIQPYQIGKYKYTLQDDTRPITAEDKEGKYHRFRTILRQHNIARKETAFEVLVNLFLAKIVDEEENPTDLHFYWKGIAYDNYYDFIDRLQKLYQIGMDKFLKDEVMYISNEQIENAFWAAKRNATKETIKEYFRKLKFFSNNAFSLINVHNERLFNKNTKVIVELVQMWQNLRLKTEEQNQFLGDMFEYFLDNSIKQSEGQFFTPIPITKFIVSSLPLENKIETSSDPLKTIDYACGSGHFLNEYAHQIKPLVQKYKNTDIKKYYENIFGIEKEDRLAKIAKVSAYMYGQDEIKIIEEDALSEIEEIKNESFDVLIANPPFAVEGFLLNLTEKEKQKYELIKTTELNSNTNNIQCFFIERAKQLINSNGVLGIIIPSSILSNTDNTHIATREIILKYFDIISLVELGSGTFGKTGTNTVILFLRRKSQKPEQAKHYLNRVEDFFDNEENKEVYEDIELVKKYCEHNEIPFEEYKKLFNVNAENISQLDELFKIEIFATYKKEFENSTEIKNLKKKKNFKDKTKEKQTLELNKRLLKFIFDIEKDKLYYFILAYKNPQKVLIIKSPKNSKEQKKFLGYEWSGAKGSEGIKYNGGESVNDIITPLFNPTNRDDETKISYLIKQNFLGKEIKLDNFSEYKELINYSNLENLLDFSRKDFTKTFSLNPQKKVEIKTKWEMVKLGEVLKEQIKSKIQVSQAKENPGKYKFFTSGEKVLNYKDNLVDNENIYLSTGGNAIVKYFNGKASYSTDTYVINSNNETKILTKFIFYILESIIDLINELYFKGTGLKHLQKNDFKEIKIPLPPKDIQEKIVQECEKIDNEVIKAKENIQKANEEIEKKFNELLPKSNISLRLSDDDIFDISIGKRVIIKDIENNTKGIPVYSANVFEPIGLIDKYLITDFSKSSLIWGIDGDWMVNYIEKDKEFYPTDHCGVLRIKKENIVHLRYLKYLLEKKGKEVNFSRNYRASINRIKGIKINIPPYFLQNEFAKMVEKLENIIKLSNEIINSSQEKKQKIMDEYLL